MKRRYVPAVTALLVVGAMSNVACYQPQKGSGLKSFKAVYPVGGAKGGTSAGKTPAVSGAVVGPGNQLKVDFKAGEVQSACDKAVQDFNAAIDAVVTSPSKNVQTSAATSVQISGKKGAQNPPPKPAPAPAPVDALLAFETAVANLYDNTNKLVVLQEVSSDSAQSDEAKSCLSKRDSARNAAFGRKDVYNLVKALNPTGDEPRLKALILALMEESGAAESDFPGLQDKLDKVRTLESQFNDNIRKSAATFTLTPDQVKNASADLQKKIMSNAIGFTGNLPQLALRGLNDPDPVKASSLRKAYYLQYLTVASAANASALTQLLQLRSDIAKLRNKSMTNVNVWADLTVSQSMPKDVATLSSDLTALQTALVAKLGAQKDLLLKDLGADLKMTDIAPWDVELFLAKWAEIPPEVKLDRDAVMQGLRDAVSKAFGVTIAEVSPDKPVGPGIKQYAIATGKTPVANFYVYFGDKVANLGVRPLATYRVVSGKGSLPSAMLVGPSATSFSYADVAHAAREVGHLLQHLLYNGAYASLSPLSQGLSEATRDYRDIPARTLENWAFEPQVIALIQGSGLSAEQVSKLAKARAFRRTYLLAKLLYGARVDLAIHGTSPGDLTQTAVGVFNDVYGVKIDLPAAPSILGMNGKLWATLWSELSGADLYKEFAGKPLDTGVATRFRNSILAKGVAGDPNAMVKAFLANREPSLSGGLTQLVGQ